MYYHYLYLLIFLSFTLKSLIYFIFKSLISLKKIISYLSLSSILNFLSVLSLTFFKFYIYNSLSFLLFSCLKIGIYTNSSTKKVSVDLTLKLLSNFTTCDNLVHLPMS